MNLVMSVIPDKSVFVKEFDMTGLRFIYTVLRANVFFVSAVLRKIGLAYGCDSSWELPLAIRQWI